MNRKRILVVDDETLNLKIIRASLEGQPYQLDLAEDGGQGWQRLQDAEQPYDLIILDRMMPVMDGLTLLQRMKQDPRYVSAPVIMQTAAAEPSQVAEGLAAGAFYYLTKPYEPEALITIVRAALESRELGIHLARDARECQTLRNLLREAEFRFRTIEQASILAGQLARLCPQPENAALGLNELLINAVEHGNLEISYAEKSQLKWADQWESEVARRLELAPYRTRLVRVQVQVLEHELIFTIEDEGPGFDCLRYLDFEPERAFDPNGRGIAMARRMSFSSLDYQGRGNRVAARVDRSDDPQPD